MDNKPYYLAYEKRYKTVYNAGVKLWGHSSDDEILLSVLEKWVRDNGLVGKKVIEFACGEGASGVILSKLGCLYHGVDISPSALEKAKEAVKDFPNARVSLLDMVKQTTGETYDAALDSMGFHMLVTDSDRAAYLKNAYDSLNRGAPMLFFRQLYSEDSYSGTVESFGHWKEISGTDYETPGLRSSTDGIEVNIPIVPARAKTRNDYITEMQNAGFEVVRFEKMEFNWQCPDSASIFVRKP